jgi:hypothetical protein
VTEHEKIKDLLVAIDARLHAFTDREVKYYLREDFATVVISIFMFGPRLGTVSLLQQMSVSRMTLVQPSWNAERTAHVFIDNWIEKLKMERQYEELNVIFDSPPSWVADSLKEKLTDALK